MLKQFLFITFLFLQYLVSGQEIEFTQIEKDWIKNHQVINFGYEPEWAPYEIYENGEYNGIVGEYVKIIERETGIDMVPIPNMTWGKAITELKSGKINIVPCCAITPERSQFLEFSDIYIEDPMVIVTRKDFKFIGGLDDLNSIPVALPANYYSTEMIAKDYPGINIKEFNGVYECLEELSYGDADAFVGNLGVISYHINNSGFTNLKIAAPTSYKTNGIALAVTKDWIVFRDIANKVFASISPTEREQIRNEWIAVRYEHGVSWKEVFKWISFGLLIVISIFLFLLYWNKRLRKEINLRKIKEKQLRRSMELIKKQDSDKKVLLQEIHHRVKNNLQIITSIMNLQSNIVSDANSKQVLRDAIDRIKSIALIHDKIYNSKNISDVSTNDYIQSLAEEVIHNFSMEKNIQLNVNSNVDNIQLDTLVPLALILNELLTNSLKYGVKNKNNGRINIEFKTRYTGYELKYFDNGEWFDNPDSDHFGTSLINVFTEQLDGEYSLNKSKEGTEYLFQFKSSKS